MRPMTLTGTIGPMLVGTAIAAKNGPIRFDTFFALLIATLCIQIATNLFNDYYDFKSGQDADKWVMKKDTFSHQGPNQHTIFLVACTLFALATIIGVWLALSISLWFILAGILGILVGYTYSAGPYSFSSIGLGEFVAAIFLGPVITTLAYVAQGHSVNMQIVAVSIPFALLIASMILTNNIRDIKKDQDFRNTLANKLGRAKAVYLLATLLTAAYLTVIMLIVFHFIAPPAIMIVLSFPLAIRMRWSFRPTAKRVDEINGMKWAARHHWAFSILFALGVFLGT